MGLWGNMADRITGDLCKNVLGNILNLPNKLLNPLDKSTLTNPTIPGLPSLLPQGNRNQNRPSGKPLNNMFSNPFGFEM